MEARQNWFFFSFLTTKEVSGDFCSFRSEVTARRSAQVTPFSSPPPSPPSPPSSPEPCQKICAEERREFFSRIHYCARTLALAFHDSEGNALLARAEEEEEEERVESRRLKEGLQIRAPLDDDVDEDDLQRDIVDGLFLLPIDPVFYLPLFLPASDKRGDPPTWQPPS